jgi:hypothetical protein
LKKIVLTLEQVPHTELNECKLQMLVTAVSVFGDNKTGKETPREAIAAFGEKMGEIGGLHKVITPSLGPDDFDFFFDLVPEVVMCHLQYVQHAICPGHCALYQRETEDGSIERQRTRVVIEGLAMRLQIHGLQTPRGI